MCGMAGIAGYGITKEDLGIFHDLMTASQVRGKDGSGVFETNTRWIKGDPSGLIKSIEDYNFLEYHHISHPTGKNKAIAVGTQMDVIMGHVRAATVGKISEANAQPFAHGDIIGMHNGTLRDKKYFDPSGVRSDTDLFFEDIAERGLIPVLDELDHNSAYAIVMYSKLTKKLYFVKNEARPLAFAINQKRQVLYWASESEMLEWILKRKGIDYYDYEGEGISRTRIGGVMRLMGGNVWSTCSEDIKPRRNIFTKVGTIYEKVEGKIIYRRDQEEAKENTTTGKSPVSVEVPKPRPILAIVSNKDKKDDTPPFDPPHIKAGHKGPKPGIDLSVTCGTCGQKLSVLDQYKIREGIIANSYYLEGATRAEDVYYCYCSKALELPVATVAKDKLN